MPSLDVGCWSPCKLIGSMKCYRFDKIYQRRKQGGYLKTLPMVTGGNRRHPDLCNGCLFLNQLSRQQRQISNKYIYNNCIIKFNSQVNPEILNC